jgi:hypothetical protein
MTEKKRRSALLKAASPAETPLRAAQPILMTTESRMKEIAVLAEKIAGHVDFIGRVLELAGSSGEAKESAVVAFHERIVVAERQLSRVQETLRLG